MTLEQALNTPPSENGQQAGGAEAVSATPPATKPRKTRGPYNTKKKQAAAARQTPEQIGEAAFMTLSRAHDAFAMPAKFPNFWGNAEKLEKLAAEVKAAMRILQPLALRAAAKDGDV